MHRLGKGNAILASGSTQNHKAGCDVLRVVRWNMRQNPARTCRRGNHTDLPATKQHRLPQLTVPRRACSRCRGRRPRLLSRGGEDIGRHRQRHGHRRVHTNMDAVERHEIISAAAGARFGGMNNKTTSSMTMLPIFVTSTTNEVAPTTRKATKGRIREPKPKGRQLYLREAAAADAPGQRDAFFMAQSGRAKLEGPGRMLNPQ